MSRIIRRAWIVWIATFIVALLVTMPPVIYAMATGRGNEPAPMWITAWLWTEAGVMALLVLISISANLRDLKALIVAAWTDDDQEET